MPPVTAFAPPWDTFDRTGTAHDGPHKISKRRRSPSETSDGLDAEQDEHVRSKRLPTSNDPQDPYFVAGHDSANPRPSARFPHAAPSSPRRGQRRSDLNRHESVEGGVAFASLRPPLHAPQPSHATGRASLVKQHVAVMNTIMHTSLLRGDYDRAGRAFAMLLRMPRGSASLDITKNGQWGIGAEILLRQSRARDDGEGEEGVEGAVAISPEGFAAAKSYYETLLVQYPFSRSRPSAIDARTFYPAYFSLCIYQVSERAKHELTTLEPHTVKHNDDQDKHELAEVKRVELEGAREIATRMDEVLVSPPYDRFTPLLQMRGHVANWIADLAEGLAYGTHNAADGDEEISDETTREGLAELADAESARASVMFEPATAVGHRDEH